MRRKNISTQSNELLSYFFGLNRVCFDYAEAFKVFPHANESAVKELLSDMTKRGLLMRLKEGVYYLIPYDQDAETFMPDWHHIAGYLAGDIGHYVGYYSALQIHSLITQPSLKEQIVVSRQIRPSSITIRQVTFQFIFHNEDHFFGARKMWIDNFTQVQCSDLEKTIIDCLFRPEYAGGIVEIAKAVEASKNKIDFNKLLVYATRFKSQAVIKRLGFLLELFEIHAGIIKDLQSKKTASYVLLDPGLPGTGKMRSRWSIRQNIESETIKTAIFT
ncbi:MAG: type IV toxin-antitoxin system AbiEi family antitoxin [Bacteroidota bacterium]